MKYYRKILILIGITLLSSISHASVIFEMTGDADYCGTQTCQPLLGTWSVDDSVIAGGTGWAYLTVDSATDNIFYDLDLSAYSTGITFNTDRTQMLAFTLYDNVPGQDFEMRLSNGDLTLYGEGSENRYYTNVTVSSVPLPPAFILFASGLALLTFRFRK